MFYVEIENIIDNQTKILCSLLNQTFELLGREGHLVVIISLKLVLNDVIFLPTFDKEIYFRLHEACYMLLAVAVASKNLVISSSNLQWFQNLCDH